MNFFQSFIQRLVQEGHTVDIACNNTTSKVAGFYYELGCNVYAIQTSRSPLNKGNIRAIRQIKTLVENNHYDIVHCHTPIAAMCTRIACRRARKQGTKVFYTAHGFHFYKGAPLKNWLVYYPVEKICSYFTDILITINREDYALATRFLNAKRTEYVPGVGISFEKFGKNQVNRIEKRRELNLPEDCVLLLSIGELNKNKNHETVIRAIADLNVYYIIAGKGGLKNHLQKVIDQLGMTERVKLLGFRNDIPELCAIADLFVFPSYREGLGLSAIEAMACGLPLVVAENRGTRDFCVEGINGFMCQPSNREEFTNAIRSLLSNRDLCEKISEENRRAALRFDVLNINERMLEIYFG